MTEIFKMHQLNYQGVTLLKGMARKQFEEALDYFMKLPDDDILYGFRKRAGLAHPGRELGGWYSNDGSFNIYDWDEIFNTFGQWLSFFAKAYAVTDSKEVHGKLKHLIHEWGKTLEKDGYFFYSWNNNAHHYSYEKIMAGLVDSYAYAELEEAKELLSQITVWARAKLPAFRNRADGKRATFTGGEPSIRCVDNEWYTLPENLYRAYLVTGDERYKEFAGKWHYHLYWESMRQGDSSYLAGVHGYSHVNTLCSAAMAYQVTGDKKYLDTIVGACEILHKYQLLASGGYAFDEHMAEREDSNYYAVESIGKSFEAACGAYAVFKLTRYLLMFTGKAEYGDWAEKVLYNALFAALPMMDDDKRRGKTFYYADYRLGGGRKVYYEHSFPCCSGTYPQAMAEYHNIIYFYNKEELYISQYLPSVLDISAEDGRMRVEIRTGYPMEEKVEIVFKEDLNRHLKLRIPLWVKDTEVTVEINGAAKKCEVISGEWLRIDRKWKREDSLEIKFPMHLYTVPICKSHPERAALMYGPVMLAAKGRHSQINADFKNPENDIERTEAGLRFEAKDKSMQFIPYWEYKEKEWNTVYLDYLKK